MSALLWTLAAIGGLGVGVVFAAAWVFPEQIPNHYEDEFPD